MHYINTRQSQMLTQCGFAVSFRRDLDWLFFLDVYAITAVQFSNPSRVFLQWNLLRNVRFWRVYRRLSYARRGDRCWCRTPRDVLWCRRFWTRPAKFPRRLKVRKTFSLLKTHLYRDEVFKSNDYDTEPVYVALHNTAYRLITPGCF